MGEESVVSFLKSERVGGLVVVNSRGGIGDFLRPLLRPLELESPFVEVVILNVYV